MSRSSAAVGFIRSGDGIKVVAPRLEFYLSYGDINRLNEFVGRKADGSTIEMRRKLQAQRDRAVRATPTQALKAELVRREAGDDE